MIRRLVLLFLLGVLPHPAWAATCEFPDPAGTTLLDFGTYIPLQGTAATALGNVNVSCAATTALELLGFTYTIFIDGGGSGDVTARKLYGASGDLNYQIDNAAVAGTTVGDGEPGTTGVTAGCVLTLLGILEVCTPAIVYGTIPASQFAPAGAYSDTVVVRVEF